jgi:hypothetical protein
VEDLTLNAKSPVRAGNLKSARTGAVKQAEICCFEGFNSRPHRTNNLHDSMFWRIRAGGGPNGVGAPPMSQRGADTPKTPPALKDSGAKGGG